MTDTAPPRERADPVGGGVQSAGRHQVGVKGRFRARVVSAIVLMAVALSGISLGGLVFAALIAAIGALMAWEWGRMVRRAQYLQFAGADGDSVLVVHVLSYLAVCGLSASGQMGLAGASAIIGAGACVALARSSRPVLSGLGVVVIAAAGAALIWLRAQSELGVAGVLLVMVCVWATDTFAMLTGKALGGPLMAPTISPKKTWAGAIGGFLAAGLTGAIVAVAFGAPAAWPHGLWVGMVLSVAAQLGDLGESALKRHCGVKNASELIPGHGGVLDRMDGLIGATLAAVVIALVLDPSAPARVLVIGG